MCPLPKIKGSGSQINLSPLAEGKAATAMCHAPLMKVAAATERGDLMAQEADLRPPWFVTQFLLPVLPGWGVQMFSGLASASC